MRSVAILHIILVGWPGCRLCNRWCGHAGGLCLGVWSSKGTAQVITGLILFYYKIINFGEATSLVDFDPHFLFPFTIRIYPNVQVCP